jgi:4-hydroxy-tetrahydrodipicolinate synthase
VREMALSDLVDHLIRSGVHDLSPLGSTGEFAYLPVAQRLELVRSVVAGRVPVVPTVAARGTKDVIGQARAFLGARCRRYSHHSSLPSREEPERFVERVADAGECTIVR